MRISFKSFWRETFMLFPNFNLWSDDDPDYAPHKYMLFIGWLWWGVRIYFGHQEAVKSEYKDAYEVCTIRNKFIDAEMYVIRSTGWPTEYVGRVTLDREYNIAKHNADRYYFLGQNRITLTDAMRNAIIRSVEIRDNEQSLSKIPILAWHSDLDASIVCDLLNREAEATHSDRWELYNIPLPTHSSFLTPHS